VSKYANWADVTARYNNISEIGGAKSVDSHYIIYAEAQIEGALASSYTVPFSSNNLTVKDLVIDLTYGKAIAFRDTKKAKAINDSVEHRIKMLKSGSMSMVTNSGDILSSSGQGTIWSSTENYSPSFDMNDQEHQEIDLDMQQDQWDDRT